MPERTANNMQSLDLGSMIKPLPDTGIYCDPGYYCWCPNIIRGEDRKYYLVYSRWPKNSHTRGWLTESEIAIAAAERPEGPYTHLKVLLRGRGKGAWDQLMAHNPRIRRFRDSYYLYYISSREASTYKHIRYTQRTGVAVASDILGPYNRCETPIVEPNPPVHNITVNPDVAQMTDGRFLMMLKGDKEPSEPGAGWSQRVQGLATAQDPAGPFSILPYLAVDDIDTEDCCLWRDRNTGTFYAVFHAHTYIGLIQSQNGIHWERAPKDKVLVTEKGIPMENGQLFTPDSLQRPFVFCQDREPAALCLGSIRGDQWACLILPLH
jgi:hypothetical protein